MQVRNALAGRLRRFLGTENFLFQTEILQGFVAELGQGIRRLRRARYAYPLRLGTRRCVRIRADVGNILSETGRTYTIDLLPGAIR